MRNFIALEPYGDNRQLHMIVETPRGSNIKLEVRAKTARLYGFPSASARTCISL